MSEAAEQRTNSFESQRASRHTGGSGRGAAEKTRSATRPKPARWRTLRRHRRRRCVSRTLTEEARAALRRGGALQVLNLLPCMVQSKILYQHGLRHQVQRVRP